MDWSIYIDARSLASSPSLRNDTLKALKSDFLCGGGHAECFWGHKAYSSTPDSGYEGKRLNFACRNWEDVIQDIAQAIFNALLVFLSMNQLSDEWYYKRECRNLSYDEITLLVAKELTLPGGNGDFSELDRKISVQKEAIGPLKTQESNLQTGIKNREGHLRLVSSERDENKSKLQGLQSLKEKLAPEYEKKKSLTDALEKKREALTSKRILLLALLTGVGCLEEEVSSNTSKEEELSLEVVGLEQKKASLEQEHTTKASLVETISKKLEELEAVNGEIGNLQGKLASLKEQIQEKTNNIKSLEGENGTLKEQGSSLKDSIRELEQLEEKKR